MRYSVQMDSTAFEWSTRHSVQATARRTAALINALADERASPAAIADLLREHGETCPLTISAGDIADLRAAAAMLRPVFAAEHVDVAAATLNDLLARSSGTLRLDSDGGHSPWHPHLDSDDAPWGEWFLASSCLALTVLIWDRQRPPGGICASPSCGKVYVTVGSGPVRRYCSSRCATRERVAAHRRSRS
jgi:tRNA threonylcarbamoyladenosine modification (KEOPS) complex  Pcc1 subunit